MNRNKTSNYNIEKHTSITNFYNCNSILFECTMKGIVTLSLVYNSDWFMGIIIWMKFVSTY